MITERPLMIRTGIFKTYEHLVEDEKLFQRKHHLFSLGLVYGVLHNLKSSQRPDTDMVYLNQIKEPVTKDTIDFMFAFLDDGRDELEIFEEMLVIADAGVLKLEEIYNERGDIPLADLIQESKELWNELDKKLDVA